jgi:hypothetical protein
MTTSFSHLVRGHLQQAVRANVAGVFLALACVAQIPWCWCSAARGRLLGIADPSRSLLILISVLGTICVLNWVLRLIYG